MLKIYIHMYISCANWNEENNLNFSSTMILSESSFLNWSISSSKEIIFIICNKFLLLSWCQISIVRSFYFSSSNRYLNLNFCSALILSESSFFFLKISVQYFMIYVVLIKSKTNFMAYFFFFFNEMVFESLKLDSTESFL